MRLRRTIDIYSIVQMVHKHYWIQSAYTSNQQYQMVVALIKYNLNCFTKRVLRTRVKHCALNTRTLTHTRVLVPKTIAS